MVLWIVTCVNWSGEIFRAIRVDQLQLEPMAMFRTEKTDVPVSTVDAQTQKARMDRQIAQVISSDENEVDNTWKKQTDFIVLLIAYAIGLGNVWRFPYLCFKHGGGAFLIPYFLCWVFLAAPIFLLEVSLGQYLQRGTIAIWHICPIFKGVGVSNVIVSCLCNIYYCVISVWALFYLFSSFSNHLPWGSCSNAWNDDCCVEMGITNASFAEGKCKTLEAPVTQFWTNRVLQCSSGIGDFGTIRWELLGLLASVWIGTFLVLHHGITKARKAFYFSAIAPYVILFVILIRGITLPGASIGIVEYLSPNFSKLANAGTQVFYSSGIGYGSLVALGSHNTFNHNVYRDSILICIINAATSMSAGFAVFSVLGNMALKLGKPITEVVQSGAGLVFQAYPEALNSLPFPQLWSALFFVMVIILGMDSQSRITFLICVVNGVVEGLSDSVLKKWKNKRKVILAMICLVKFICGIPLVTQSGIYWLTVIDAYGAGGIPLLFIAFFEIISVAWCFGASKLRLAVIEMVGFNVSKYWSLCWRFITPMCLIILFTMATVLYRPLEYPDGTPYPSWSNIIGSMLSLSSMIAIPAYALWYLFKAPGDNLREKFYSGIFGAPNDPPDIRMTAQSI